MGTRWNCQARMMRSYARPTQMVHMWRRKTRVSVAHWLTPTCNSCAFMRLRVVLCGRTCHRTPCKPRLRIDCGNIYIVAKRQAYIVCWPRIELPRFTVKPQSPTREDLIRLREC